jgi:hypothetical protein
MQALSHLSYHVSRGQYVLCDLQGGIHCEGVILTDIAVLSRKRRFGPTDAGPPGIWNFLAVIRAASIVAQSGEGHRAGSSMNDTNDCNDIASARQCTILFRRMKFTCGV